MSYTVHKHPIEEDTYTPQVSDFVHLYLEPGSGDMKGLCGTTWRYSAPMTWYLTASNVSNYAVCPKCMATDEFAMAALANIGE